MIEPSKNSLTKRESVPESTSSLSRGMQSQDLVSCKLTEANRQLEDTKKDRAKTRGVSRALTAQNLRNLKNLCGTKKWDLIGIAGSLLCVAKCSFIGLAFGAGVATTTLGYLTSLTHYIHSPFILLPLVFVSMLAAVKSLVIPLFEVLVKTKNINNPSATLVALGGFAASLMIVGLQTFSGMAISALHLSVPHSHDLSIIFYDPQGIGGLHEYTFIAFTQKLLHGILLLSSISLGLMHYLKIKMINSKRVESV
ncbi:MAG: hypothetical protein NZO16_05005 [Deltaproteobacteria bacterium]|nr:hypothetical protein [Deltaproteobacteria bacterium]